MADEAAPANALPEIRVEKIVPARRSLACSIGYDASLAPYFKSSLLYVSYGFQVEEIPESVLSIPVLGLLVPVAWSVGATVTAGEVDSRFLASLGRVGEIMQGMYPSLSISTKVRCSAVDTPWPQGGERNCLLYTGGIDSTSSMLRNLGPNLVLASIRGTPDLPLSDDRFWEREEGRFQPFLKSTGVERQVIETNALDVVSLSSLNALLKGAFTGGWWENLSHGLFLLSLCAPFTYVGKIKKMLIASSYSQVDSEPWGSGPASDTSVAWGSVTTLHDSFDLPRLEKMKQVLAPYIAEHPGLIQFRVCTGKRQSRLASGTLNCGVCPKCVRTMLGLMHAGVDPVTCGFPPPDFAEIKKGMISGRLRPFPALSVNSMHASRRSPDRELAARYPEYAEFLGWFYDWKIPVAAERKWVSKVAPKGSRRRKVLRDIFR